MGKIILLDDALSNKIAAGEVVERPASVVKELVENSIDAGSSIIEIDVEEAGLAKIRIIDNGAGIEEEDVLLAFQRHATSKIKDEKDLFRIKTLGFRGEALPSIASVSRLELKTSTGTSAGTRVIIEGNQLVTHEKAPSRKGTDITVTDLFFNTPARLKYMKTIHTELGNITDLVNRLALAHPEVSFRLTHNGRQLLHTNGNGDVRQVLAAIYGMNIVKMMVPISGSSLDFTVNGYISMPEVTRASRNYISTMINGRFIKNYSLVKAIQEGYHTLLPIGRFPIVMLNIVMDPILVDVNVHPSKLEVRLSKEQELNQLVSSLIKDVFKKKELIPSGFTAPKIEKPKTEQTFLELDHMPVAAEPVPARKINIEETSDVSERRAVEQVIQEKRPVFPDFSITGSGYVQKSVPTVEPEPEQGPSDILDDEPVEIPAEVEESLVGISAETEDSQAVEDASPSRIPPFYPIGQMHGTYILAQNDKGLYLIDQHAAQERIKYEYFKEKVGQVASELQELLVPITLEYSTDEAIKINENIEELEKVGVFLEEFGLNSYIVRSHPVWFPKGEEKEIIEDMIEQLLMMKKVDIKKLREEAAIMMSCKGSIKANRHLRNDEIQALLDKLRTTTDPFTCPHGRPIIIHFSTYELEKMFKRVM
ncbi:DNA mismatch repair endonuclease MutL [Bacillus sp. DNRA2]|uniref:DNA mismatch repair endonuclease MutL n=1 Tax=Bacillus sp. DNRA2 TaxID=2723053 RepID=UPI00145CBED7|nr:DNA mismatch repair endonuclease MutL [Bacillus sp. DNRA2]NMD69562.1 DNA mismatch repair endonuclease MutL [Bacillus sp. DNRA2]